MSAAAARGPVPWKATLCLTYLCNLRCGFCRIWERRPSGEMDAHEWRLVLSKAPRFLWIDLTGGEPLLHPEFDEIMAAVIAIHRPLVVHFPTNGSFPGRIAASAERVRGSRLVVTVSIDGPPELHDRMRGTPGSFAKAAESLRLLRALPGVRAAAGLTVTSENEHAVGDTARALAEAVPGFGAADLHLNFAQVSSHYYGNDPSMFREAAGLPNAPSTSWPPSAVVQSWLERRYRALLPRFLRDRRTPVPCRSLTASLFISPTGDVHPCITDARIAGRLREADYDLRRLLASHEARALREKIAAGDCPHCWTPCEAYPTLIDRLPGARAVLRAAASIVPPRSGPRPEPESIGNSHHGDHGDQGERQNLEPG